MKGELTMRALIILVITFAILATQFYWGVRKKFFRSNYSSCHDCAIYYNKFFGKNSRVRYHWNY